ncbi:MAG: hypothetical protein COA73_13185 [Candidatus Hydrogenedentota bacterium]|nr:MAG: hypothetical protein COA73_13185 [Candidatus Hydrogenedentota bacterium]
MKPDEFDSMDDYIDAALRSESWRTVPLGFQRSVGNTLRVAGAIRSERLRFRYGLLAGLGLFTLLFGSTSMYMVLGGIFSAMERSIPGFWGHLDSAWYSLSQGWPLGVLIGGAAILTGGLVFFYREALPYRKHLA